jgi:hypothetical protein
MKDHDTCPRASLTNHAPNLIRIPVRRKVKHWARVALDRMLESGNRLRPAVTFSARSSKASPDFAQLHISGTPGGRGTRLSYELLLASY